MGRFFLRSVLCLMLASADVGEGDVRAVVSSSNGRLKEIVGCKVGGHRAARGVPHAENDVRRIIAS